MPDDDEVDGVPVYRFRFLEALSSGRVSEILQLRRQVVALKQWIQPDVVHFNLSAPSLFFHLQTNSPIIPSSISVQLALPLKVADERTLLGQALLALAPPMPDLTDARWKQSNAKA